MFDVDGTLVQSLNAEGVCFPRACEMALGLEHVSGDWDSYAHPSDSGIVAELVQRHLGRAATAEDLAGVERCFLALLKETYKEHPELCRPVAGAVDALRQLRRLPDTAVSLATAGWSTTAMYKLSVAGFEVADIPMASSHDAAAKVDIMRIAVERAQAHAGVSCFSSGICIGDAAGDARAAAALGFGFIGIDTSGWVRDVEHRFLDFSDLAAFTGAMCRIQGR